MARANQESPLAMLGFDADSCRVYGVVVRNPRSTYDELAWASGIGGKRLDAALATLGKAALIRTESERVVPLPPEDAVGRLIVDQASVLREERERLEEARRILTKFVVQHHASTAFSDESVTVEVIRGRDLVGLLRELAASAPGEMLFMRPDQWKYDDGRRSDEIVRDLIVEEGRPSRVLYPARALEEAPAAIRSRAEVGEQVRLLASVPTRMAIFGTSLALIPQRLGTDAERVLVIRQDSMVGALRLYFDNLWERALSIPGFDSVLDRDEQGERRLLLQQLSSGAKDEQIARSLGISLRTVRRRVSDLMDALGAESRFQAGAEAVRRGWL